MRLFDLHCDTLALGLTPTVSFRHTGGAVDAARGSRLDTWIQCFAAFLPDGLSAAAARQRCEMMLDVADRWEREDPAALHIIRNGTVPQAICHGLLTVENAGALGDEPDVMGMLCRRHVRVLGITWNGDNAWACGCHGTVGGGLTAVGRRQIAAAAACGMVMDVSHLGETGFWQLMDQPELWVMATHSDSAAVCRHPRNLTDDQFCALRDRGGVVGLNLYAPFLGGDDRERLSHRVMRHLEHFLSLDGERCVCLGCDFDGMDIPSAWDGMWVLNEVYADLAAAGYPAELLENLFFDNARRFFAAH